MLYVTLTIDHRALDGFQALHEETVQAVIGCGERGRRAYGAYALAYPSRLRVVACAESDPQKRDLFAMEHRLEPDDAHADWRGLFTNPRPAFEAVVVATPADNPPLMRLRAA